MKKILLIIVVIIGIIFAGLYVKYRIAISNSDYVKFGRITKIEIWTPLDNIEPKVLIYRMSNPKRGCISMMSLKKFLELKRRGLLY